MKNTKRILAAVLACIFAILITTVSTFLLIDDEILVSYLVKRLESVSETRISYRDGAHVSRTFTPELIINDLVIDNIDDTYQLNTDSLKVMISLPRLLIGQLDIPHLLLGDTTIHVREDRKKYNTQPRDNKLEALNFSALKLSPTLHDVQISSFMVSIKDAKLQLASSQISGLSMRLLPGSDTPELSAQVKVAGERLFITTQLHDLSQANKKQRLPFSIKVNGEYAESTLVGQVDFSQPDAVVQAEIHAHALDLKRFPTGVKAIEIPGTLTIKAKLSGPFNKLTVQDMAANWIGPGESSLNLNGSIKQIFGLKGVDLKLAGQLEQTDWLAPALPTSMSVLKSAELTAQVSSKQSLLNVSGFNLKVKTAEKLNLLLTGQFDLAQLPSMPDVQHMDLKLTFNAPTTRAARALIFDEIPEFGAISASAEMRSTTHAPSLENIKVEAIDKAGFQVDLTGRIAHAPLNSHKPNKGYDLDVTMTANNASVMAERIGIDLPLNGPLDLSYKISGDTQSLQLNRIKLLAGRKNETLIEANGNITFRKWDQKDPLDSLDLLIEVQSQNTRFLSAWVTQDFPVMAYQAHGRLHTIAGKHRIDDFRLTTPAGESLDMSEIGYAESVSFIPEFAIAGIHIEHSARTDDVASLNKLFTLDAKIPSIGPLEFRSTITGTDKKLLISDFTASVGLEDTLLVEAKGQLGHISTSKKWQLENTDIDINARSTSSQAMAEAFGWRIPQLGPVSAQARFNDEDKTLGIDAIQILVGDIDKPVVKSIGSWGDLYTTSKVHIETELDLEGQHLLGFVENQEFTEPNPLTGKMILSDSSGSLGIDTLYIKGNSEDILSLNIDGRFQDFQRPETLELNCQIKSQNVNLLAELFDLNWPGEGLAQMDIQVKQVDKRLVFDADWVSGKEKVDMLLHGDFTTSPPTVSGKITAQNFFLPDPAEEKRNKIDQAHDIPQQPADKEPVFSLDPMGLAWMHKVNLDLDIDIQSFDREYSEAVSARFIIDLHTGHLSLKPATLVYPKGQAFLDLQFDGKTGNPHFSFTLSGDNLDPWYGLNVDKYQQVSDLDAKGAELDIDIWLAAGGKNLHEMASNIAGDIYITMKHGKISQAKLNLLFVDLVGWVSNLAKQRYSDVNCGIADYTIRRGKVNTNAFFIDTKTITITGEGTLDLADEQIDYTFIPKKKSRLIARAEPVTLKGPLNDPVIQAIPVKSAALTFGTLLFAPYVFAGMVATEFATEKMAGGDIETSVCVEYEKNQKEQRKKIREKSRQTTPFADSEMDKTHMLDSDF